MEFLLCSYLMSITARPGREYYPHFTEEIKPREYYPHFTEEIKPVSGATIIWTQVCLTLNSILFVFVLDLRSSVELIVISQFIVTSHQGLFFLSSTDNHFNMFDVSFCFCKIHIIASNSWFLHLHRGYYVSNVRFSHSTMLFDDLSTQPSSFL